MLRLRSIFSVEEHQYVPFVAGAIIFGLIGFPLGLTLAHAAAQGVTLGGYRPALTQVHGHLQLTGWLGLFVMGMGLRLMPRFTGVKVRPPALVPVIFALMTAGLLLRAAAQPFADERSASVPLVASAALEAAAALLFAAAIMRCLASGRREQFLYSPFFAAAAVWLVIAAILEVVFVVDAVQESALTIPTQRSEAVAFAEVYGFVAMFIFAVSLRTFPIFFGRRPAQPSTTLAAWALANVGVAAYVASLVWWSYDSSADVRLLETIGFLDAGAALIILAAALQVFRGQPHRLRASARQSMRFVRSAYGWLLLGAGLQVFFSLRALADERPPTLYEIDGVRHFLALGFMTTMIMGMSLLVLPRLAMRRAQPRPGRVIGPALLILLYGAAATRGAGSLLVNELQIENGFWTMSVGGVFGVLAIAAFAGYLLRAPPPPEIPLTVRPE